MGAIAYCFGGSVGLSKTKAPMSIGLWRPSKTKAPMKIGRLKESSHGNRTSKRKLPWK